MNNAYKEDLAYVHDVGFTSFLKSTAPAILKIINDHGIKEAHVVDLGCGSGVWARELTKHGHSVFGIDISSNMIELARVNAPKAKFKVGSFLQAKLPFCNVITSFGECFNYLFDKKNNERELINLFKKIWKALPANGIFIFDIAEPGRGFGPKQKHTEGSDWCVLVDVEEKDDILIRHITTFRKINNLYRRSKEVHKLLLYKGSNIASILRKIGFKVRLVRKYGSWRFPKSWVGVIAYKP